jgi:hypothetical protein
MTGTLYNGSQRESHFKAAKEFLDTVLGNMPFNIRAIRVDGGSEFYSEFEQERQRT